MQWRAVIAELFRALSKIHNHIEVTASFFEEDITVHELRNLEIALRNATNFSARLLCTMHDSLRILHVHINDPSSGTTASSGQSSWNEWMAHHANSSHADLATLGAFRQRYGSDQLTLRSFCYCGLVLCLNTIQQIKSEFQQIGNDLGG
jgi:hypothetical protein